MDCFPSPSPAPLLLPFPSTSHVLPPAASGATRPAMPTFLRFMHFQTKKVDMFPSLPHVNVEHTFQCKGLFYLDLCKAGWRQQGEADEAAVIFLVCGSGITASERELC